MLHLFTLQKKQTQSPKNTITSTIYNISEEHIQIHHENESMYFPY